MRSIIERRRARETNMAKNQSAAKSAKRAAEKRWRGDAARDLATYRFLFLGKILVQHTGQQENIADQIGRHSDLLATSARKAIAGWCRRRSLSLLLATSSITVASKNRVAPI
jgi:hypothetical protein